jgi:hypothetical protein
MRIEQLTAKTRPRASFIGCLHLLPLPGSPLWAGDLKPVVERCLREAEIYSACGVDGLLIENTHDLPYLRAEAEACTVAAMAVIASQVRERYPQMPIGIQILAAADIASLEVAVTCDLDFIRAEGFAYAHTADEGIIQANAGRILRRRAHLQAQHIRVFTDIKKKHSAHALTADLSLREFAKGAIFCAADGLIITGNATGEPPEVSQLREVADLGLPIAVGSGVDLHNIHALSANADMLIVGSACKIDGCWRNTVDASRLQALLNAMREV